MPWFLRGDGTVWEVDEGPMAERLRAEGEYREYERPPFEPPREQPGSGDAPNEQPGEDGAPERPVPEGESPPKGRKRKPK